MFNFKLILDSYLRVVMQITTKNHYLLTLGAGLGFLQASVLLTGCRLQTEHLQSR